MSDDPAEAARRILDRPSGYYSMDPAPRIVAAAYLDAATEIERLRVALERADILIRRASLSQNGEHWEAVMQYETARAALENT